MNGVNHISDVQLSKELDFKTLKEEGLAYIQQYSGANWTNLNPSDPGVTILDQLCYAFTELGYCGEFPMKDILTKADGTLEVDDQFYRPENILTMAPITIDDYRKYILDAIPEIKNVVIIPLKTDYAFVNGIYQVFFWAPVWMEDDQKLKELCIAVFSQLNASRNIGEFFLMPKALEPVKYQVNGQLEIAIGYDLDTVLAKIQQHLNDYVFPGVTQTGYNELLTEGETTDTIFNGPELKNGWIPETSLKPKKNKIQAFEITSLIQSIEGVQSIQNVSFCEPPSMAIVYELRTTASQILVLEVLESLNNKASLQIQHKGLQNGTQVQSKVISALATMPTSEKQVQSVASIDVAPDLPKGKYRDISSYYSIQNTFPETYAIGHNTVDSNASDFQIAQSRQLAGYLTLFDQVLTNQFAQLANVGKLFSFKNAISGDPEDLQHFLDTKSRFEKHHLKYPAPYKNFAPSYFYQSLYKAVPYIKPLLRNNDSSRFDIAMKSSLQMDKQSWEDYKGDPYNTYIRGLMVFMEDEQINLSRRNKILDHLLARHGESPLIVDTIISNSVYSGDVQKDQLIIKSLLLQNLGILSYNRVKAYNFLGASTLKSDFKKVTKKLQQKFIQGNQSDFIFDTERINKQQKITALDVIDYATVELKLSLLFALRTYYQNYLIDHPDPIALWMIEHRKGVLFIETNLLIESADFEICITEDSRGIYSWKSQEKLDYSTMLLLKQAFNTDAQTHIQQLLQDTDIIVGTKAITFHREIRNDWPKDWFTSLEDHTYSIAIKASWGDDYEVPLNTPLFTNTGIFIFPNFITVFTTSAFKNRLDYYLESQLPVQVSSECFFVNQELLKAVILEFVAWHNSLTYNGKTDKLHAPSLVKDAAALAARLVELKLLANGV